uniref:Cell cycle checkpoint control protein RAD9A n=1 Tax=Serinus canaria TaxID=9135 RepID=A0A8C9N5A5_SERCA
GAETPEGCQAPAPGPHPAHSLVGLSLRAVNSSRSAFASFLFAPLFFQLYEPGIHMKSFLGVFRSLPSLEKSVGKCLILLKPRASRLVLQLHCKYGVTKTHNLAFQECERLQAVFDTQRCASCLCAPARLLADAVVHFPPTLAEVTLGTGPGGKISLRNYVEDEAEPSKTMVTELCLAEDEFQSVAVVPGSHITFCLKEFRMGSWLSLVLTGCATPCHAMPFPGCHSLGATPCHAMPFPVSHSMSCGEIANSSRGPAVTFLLRGVSFTPGPGPLSPSPSGDTPAPPLSPPLPPLLCHPLRCPGPPGAPSPAPPRPARAGHGASATAGTGAGRQHRELRQNRDRHREIPPDPDSAGTGSGRAGARCDNTGRDRHRQTPTDTGTAGGCWRRGCGWIWGCRCRGAGTAGSGGGGVHTWDTVQVTAQVTGG